MNEEPDITNTKNKYVNKNGEINEISLTPSLTALLKPSAEYLGTTLRDQIKAKIEPILEKKRDENIRSHVQSAEKKIGMSFFEVESDNSNANLRDFNKWIEGAQDIDPDNKILAELWQGILIDIVKGKKDNRLLIKTLNQLETNEAEFLLKFKKGVVRKKRNTQTDYMIEKLKRLNLVELSFKDIVNIREIITLAILLLLIAAEIYSSFFVATFRFGTQLPLLILASSISLIYLILSNINNPPYQSTWLCNRLFLYVSDDNIRLAEREKKDKDKPC